MVKKVLVDSDGLVVNIIEYDSDAEWAAPSGIDVVDDGPDAEVGGTWNGTTFSRIVSGESSRLDILMAEGPATHIYDASSDSMVDRPAADIAADKAEVLGLLQAKSASGGDLSWSEINKMLSLERES